MHQRKSRPLHIFILVGIFALMPQAPVKAANSEFDAGWEYYQDGMFVQALEVWEHLARSGDATAQFNLATMYEQGRGVDMDPVKAEYWNNLAVKADYPPALHNLALRFLSERQNRNAISLLEKSVRQEFPASLYTLGKIYEFGIGVSKSPADAFRYIQMAAKSGFAPAQYNLGKMYRDGFSVTANDHASAHWFRKAAEQGYGKAQNHLSTRYATGRGVVRDDIQALKWSILAGRQGIKGAIQKVAFFKNRMSLADIMTAEGLANSFEAH